MKTVEQLIGDLLLQHNCVIVPGFGGFVAKSVSARIDYSKGTMMPPRKSLLFNKQLVNNDGLLVNEFSLCNKLSFDEANTQVGAKVIDWNRILKEGARIELDRVGRLYKDAEGNLCFEQDRFFNLLLESFGLSQVHFMTDDEVKSVQAYTQSEKTEVETVIEKPVVPVAPMTVVEEKEEVIQPAAMKDEPVIVQLPEQPKKKRKVWRYAVAACLLPVAFYSFWIPMTTDVLESGVISIKDFNPFYRSTDGSYIQKSFEENMALLDGEEASIEEQIADANLPADVNAFPYKYDDDTYILVRVDRSAEATTISEPVDAQVESGQPVEVAETEQVFSPDAMHFIVGCFGSETNAKNLVSSLKAQGMDALIVDVKNGLHRVSAGAAMSQEALQSIRSQAESNGLTGWVLK